MATSAAAAPASKPCYNKDCTEAKPERPRKGWRLHNGDYAELCDRCASLYEEGRFCDIFHVNAAGWRTCESCGKQVHCGCIVSVLAFTLLDPGGIECVICARKDASSMAPNPAWPPSLLFQASSPDRFSGLCGKNWNQLAGTGPVPWRQAPSLFNSIPRPEMQPRVSYEIDASTSIDRLVASERYPTSSIESKRVEEFSERFMKNVKISVIDNHSNGIAGPKSEMHLNPCISNSQQSTSLKEEHSTPAFGLAVPYALLSETNGHLGVAGPHFRPSPPSALAKHFYGNMLNDLNSPIESPMRNGRPRGDPRGKSQLLPRYWPRITDQELQRISGDTNSVITPLFEKMLSVSDAGKIGRLVLPKKCAEAYFPPISQPEGLPLKVQDAKGSEWTFQFRFWPNNNSRMYVLEGVTPCIQSMQLQAGDIVTFSRLEPEGKLIMGFRKASAAPSDQENEAVKVGNCVHEVNGEVADPNSWSKGDKSGYIAKEVLGSKSSLSRKRKSSTLASKSKRLRIEDEDIIELKLTWEEAQRLLRPPPNLVPSILMIDGFEFEEYEDAPVLGKPTLFTTNNRGEKIQWIQCEDCMKWRKLLAECLLPSRWTCAENSWDLERSSCSAAQELTPEEIEDVVSSSCANGTTTGTRSNKKIEWSGGLKKKSKKEEEVGGGLEGLDALAHMAIIGEGGIGSSSSCCQVAATTTKHPRHRAGCTCIVCIQPPSGKGPKHKQTCTCNVCVTVKRRFRTLMLRREKKQQVEAAATKKEQSPTILAAVPPNTTTNRRRRRRRQVGGKNEAATSSSNSENDDDDDDDEEEEEENKLVKGCSPFKCGIDLNIQPEREEELSPASDPPPKTLLRVHQDDEEDEQQQQTPPPLVLSPPPPPSTDVMITTSTSIEENRGDLSVNPPSTTEMMPPTEAEAEAEGEGEGEGEEVLVAVPDNKPIIIT